MPPLRPPSGTQLALAGMLTLAVAMGIGRFAFTPVLPMMQKDAGLSLAAGGWLASANYVGYFVGALSAIWIRAAAPNVIRAALVAIALLTAGMGAVHGELAWLALRGLAGVASAWALVFASSWVLQQLAATGEGGLTGIVFGGVGLGIALAGGLCLVFLQFSWSSGEAWVALGVVALLLTLSIWPVYATANDPGARAPAAPRPAVGAPFWLSGNLDLVAHYACFGFGYIIPATFLPVMAKQAIADPAIFGWAWPIFGAASLISTLAAGWLSAHMRNRLLWAAAHGVMAVGVAVPVVWSGIGGIVLSALCVGGTFMVATLAAMQEARRVAPADSARLIAAMTAAFAVGQILGPVLVSSVAGGQRGLEISLIAAAVPLFLSALALWLSGAGEQNQATATPIARSPE